MTNRLQRERGIRMFALGTFWPISLIDLNAEGGIALIPNTLWLIEEDYVAVEIADLPSFPAQIVKASGDMVEFVLSNHVHSSVLELAGFGLAASRTEDLPQAA